MNKELQLALTRFVVLVIALLNSTLAHYGKPLIKSDEAFIYQTLSDLFLIGSIAWAYWRNNNISRNAIQAQEFKNKLDKGEVEFEGAEVVTDESEVAVDNVSTETNDDDEVYPTGTKMN